MPSPRLDDANIEYSFTIEESIACRILTPDRIAWYQTKYAQYFKQKAASLIPEERELEYSWILKISELEGRMTMIQEILDDHKEAMIELNGIKQAPDPEAAFSAHHQSMAEKASSLVHKS